MWTSVCHKCTGRGTGASAGVPVSQPVVRRRSMMVSIGQRTPTNKTGKPLRYRAQSGRIPAGQRRRRDGRRPPRRSAPRGCGRRWTHKARDKGSERVPRCPGVRRRSQPHPWQVAGWGHLHKPINAQVHPHAIERVLDNVDDARLPGSRRAIQDDDLSWCTGLCQAISSLAARRNRRPAC